MFKCGVILFIFTNLRGLWVGLGNTVNCDTLAPQRKHEKTPEFYTDYPLFCMLDAFLICFLMYFSTVKRVISDHAKKHVNYSDKLRRAFHPRNASAIELHFVCQICTLHRDLSSFNGIKKQRKNTILLKTTASTSATPDFLHFR